MMIDKIQNYMQCYPSLLHDLKHDISFRNIIVAKFQGKKFRKKAITQTISYDFFLQFFIKYSIHHPLSADTKFKFLALILSKYGIYKISSLCLSKSRNFARGVTDLEFCNVKVLCLKLSKRPHFLQNLSQI